MIICFRKNKKLNEQIACGIALEVIITVIVSRQKKTVNRSGLNITERYFSHRKLCLSFSMAMLSIQLMISIKSSASSSFALDAAK
jgi:hypothetical protein